MESLKDTEKVAVDNLFSYCLALYLPIHTHTYTTVWKSKDPSLLPLVDDIFSVFSFLPFPSLLSIKQSNRICLSRKKETPSKLPTVKTSFTDLCFIVPFLPLHQTDFFVKEKEKNPRRKKKAFDQRGDELLRSAPAA